jgi:hypothetical protein
VLGSTVIMGAAVAGTEVSAASAAPIQYAPVDRPGPPLSVPAATLAAALTCGQSLQGVSRDVVLMLEPTLVSLQQAYSWNYVPAFRANHIPYCEVAVPQDGDGDVQVAAEYIVNAIRTVHAETGRQVELFGWSQGASTSPRWALRWWPDLRPMVASQIGLEPDNEGGSDTVEPICISGVLPCIPAAWQEVRRITGAPSNFMTALNSGQQTFTGIAYTNVYSLTDEVAGLNFGADPVGPLPPAPNVLNANEQAECPTQLYEHLTITASSMAYAVVMAAVRSPGHVPDLSKINFSQVCSNLLMPYVTPVSLAAAEASIVATLPGRLLTGRVAAEPPLGCYVYAAGCPGS